jgi:hypothetical protein
MSCSLQSIKIYSTISRIRVTLCLGQLTYCDSALIDYAVAYTAVLPARGAIASGPALKIAWCQMHRKDFPSVVLTSSDSGVVTLDLHDERLAVNHGGMNWSDGRLLVEIYAV